MATASEPRTAALHPSRPKPLEILIPLFTDMNVFDATGPIEVLSSANRGSSLASEPFNITLAASADLTRSVEKVRLARDVSLVDATKDVGKWDVIILPGGMPVPILGMVGRWKESGAAGDELMALLDAYLKRDDGLVVSVCTGSLFLGALGALKGRTATSHWAALSTLKKLCGESSEGAATGGEAESQSTKTDVVRARWVDSGDDEAASEKFPRIITSGGVACGIDATFHLLDLTVGSELAESAAKSLDYKRRGKELQPDWVISE